MAVTEAERERTKRRIQQWAEAAPGPQALRDEEVRQGDDKLDWAYVRKPLTPLAELKGQPEIRRRLEPLRTEVKRSAAVKLRPDSPN